MTAPPNKESRQKSRRALCSTSHPSSVVGTTVSFLSLWHMSFRHNAELVAAGVFTCDLSPGP